MVVPEANKRISKVDAYLNCAENFAYRSTCLKRKYGAVVVKDDAVISTGYNGSPRGFENCCDVGVCPRMERGLHQGEGYGMCRAYPCGGQRAFKLFQGTDHGRRFVPGRREPGGLFRA